MAPTTFSLIETKSTVSAQSFISTIQKLDVTSRPVYVGRCQHWIHAPKLSQNALIGAGKTMKKWDYLFITKASGANSFTIPYDLMSSIENNWSITSEISDDQLENIKSAEQTRRAAPIPDLPRGWDASDHTGLDAAQPPPDLEASLALSAHPLGADKDAEPLGLKEFIRTFGSEHTAPVNMLNLLSFVPGQVSRYLQYIEAFTSSTGIKYGGQPYLYAPGAPDWTSKPQEAEQEGGWERLALVWYPSIWHFGKMLDDSEYADVDRKFKQGSLRDNPLICCTEVDVEYID